MDKTKLAERLEAIRANCGSPDCPTCETVLEAARAVREAGADALTFQGIPIVENSAIPADMWVAGFVEGAKWWLVENWRGRTRLDNSSAQHMREKTYEQCADELDAILAEPAQGEAVAWQIRRRLCRQDGTWSDWTKWEFVPRETYDAEQGGRRVQAGSFECRALYTTPPAPIADKAGVDEALAQLVYKYIDRMNDVDPEVDPAERILAEFTREANAALQQEAGR